MASTGTKILVVDDDTHLARALDELLTHAGYEVVTAGSAEEALDRLRDSTFHLVLSDLQLPGRNGISLIKMIHEACPETKCVLITAHGSTRTAVTALKRGAVEYIAKPIKPRRLLALIASLLQNSPEYLSNRLLAAEKREATVFEGLVARSSAMLDLFERIRALGATEAPLLISGEAGCGKEMVARAVHAHSGTAQGLFVAVPGAEASSWERGRLTELASELAGGTLFIDEVSAISAEGQAHLLHIFFLDRTTPPVRVIASTRMEPRDLVTAGKVSQELYFRLSASMLHVPPLRERAEDIPLLAADFLREFAERYAKPVHTLPAETQRLLGAYGWPGNVRELRNVIEQAVLLSRMNELDPLLLPQMLHRGPGRQEVLKIPIGTAMDQIEREVILRTLEANDGNKTATAEVLGISRRSIYNKLAIYGIDTSGDDRARAG